jgi:hypothetical protein
MLPSEKAGWQEKNVSHQGQQCIHDDAYYPKWNREQPKQRPNNQKQERQWPTEGQ